MSYANNNGLGNSNEDSTIDHTRLVAPKVDLGRMSYSFDLPLGWTLPLDLRHGLYGMGAGAPIVVSGNIMGSDPLMSFTIGGAAFGAGAMSSFMTDRSVNSPRDYLRTWTRGWQLPRSDPLTSDQILDYEDGCPIHGIERIYDDGTVETSSGARYAFIRMTGPNTEMQRQDDENSMTEGLTAGIRGDIHGDFCWYMTTAEEVVESHVQKYKEAVYSERFAGPEWELLREYLHDVIAYESQSEPSYWEASENLSYAVVEVSESDVRTPTESAMSRVDDIRERMPGLSSNDSRARARSNTSSDAALARQLKNRLDTRVENMIGAISSADGTDAYRAGPTEVAMIASDYWGGSEIDMNVADSAPQSTNLAVWPSIDEASTGEGAETHRPTAVERELEREFDDTPGEVDEIIAGVERVDAMSDGESGQREIQSPRAEDTGSPEDVFDGDSTAQQIAEYAAHLREHLLDSSSGVEVSETQITPEQTAMAPSQFDVEDGFIRVGDEYAKTFWITGWSETPQPNFLKGLQRNEHFAGNDSNSGRVDYNLCVRVKDIAHGDAEEFLNGALDKLNVEIQDDPNQIRTDSLNSDEDYYRLMAYLLHTSTSVRPWRINGYLTVRAGTKQAIKTAQNQLESGYITDSDLTIDLGKRAALEKAEESTTEAIKERAPGLVLTEDPGMIDVLFKSGFPTSPDLYDQKTGIDRTQLCLTGAVGAMFPLSMDIPRDEGGVECGRHRYTGLKMYADNFVRGKAPHKLGIGDSGSSKTFTSGKRLIRWWAAEEDRTVVVCDTMREYLQHVEITNGNHIEVDGSTTINPLELASPTGDTTGELSDSGEMTRQAAKDWILTVVEQQGGNPDNFSQTVEQLLTKTYERADIDINDPTTFDNGDPNMSDFVETMDYMERNPDEFTLGETGSDTENIQDEIPDLKRKLVGFTEYGQYAHMMGESDVELEPGAFNYLDLSQVEHSGSADTSSMLPLMLRQVYELVKRAPGETIFLVDEAHFLLQSERTRAWLSKSSRHWRHYRGSLHFITHRPDEFISGDEDEDNHKDNIRGQCSEIEIWRLEEFDRRYANVYFGNENEELNEDRWKYAKNSAVTGESKKPFSTSMLHFSDHKGWYTNNIRAGPVETAFLSWDPDDHGPFEPYAEHIINGGSMEEYEQLWAEGEIELNQSPAQPAQPIQQPAATDGGMNTTGSRPRDENGRFLPTEGDD